MEAMALSFPFSVVPPLRAASTLSTDIHTTCAVSKTPEKTLVSATNSSSNVPRKSARTSSTTKAFKPARRDAIEGIKTATDLESALKRAEGILQVTDYNNILRYFGESKKWSHVIQLFGWMQEHEELNFATCSTYFKYMGLSRNPVKALKAYDSIKDVEIKLHVSVCNSLLGCLVKNGQSESALKLFDQMKFNGLVPDLFTYSTLLKGCSKLKAGYTTAMKLLEEIKAQNLGMDSVIYLTLLTICASNNLSGKAELYFQQMKNEGHQPNLFHYCSLLNAYAEDRDHIKADMLINDMRSLGIAPNKVTLTILLKVYARGGLFEKAKELLVELEASGYAQVEMAYAIVIDNLERQGKLEEAKELFAAMNEKFVISVSKTPEKTLVSATNSSSNVPRESARASSTTKAFKPARRDAIEGIKIATDLESALKRAEGILHVKDYNSILRYFGESKKWSHVSQLFGWMQEHEELDAATYSLYFKYMGLSRNPVKALKAFDSIGAVEIKLHAVVCTSLLSCLVRNGRAENALKLFHRMKYDGLVPDLFTYSTLLKGCSKMKAGYTTAMKLLEEIKAQNLGMNSVIYSTLLTICASNNLSGKAELYFQQMKNEGHQPNLFHYSSLLNAYAEDRDHIKAEMLINDMRSLGIAPNKVTLTTLLKVYARGGLFEKAKELLVELEASGYAQVEMAYAILIDNLARQGKLEEAKELFAAMNEKFVNSDGYGHRIMISAFCHFRLLKEAKQLAKEYESKYAKYNDVVIINNLLRAYCNNGDMESVMQTLKNMDENGVSPDLITFDILIKYFSRDKLHHLAYKMIEGMNSRGHRLDEELCTKVMVNLGEAGFPSEAFSVYNMLRHSQRSLQESLHERILQILVRAGLLEDAYLVIKDFSQSISDRSMEEFTRSFMKSGNVNLINDVLKAYHQSRNKISMEMFEQAINRYLEKQEKKELLLHLLQWMAGQGYCVDAITRDFLLKNSQYCGSKQIIAEILAKQKLLEN